MVPRVFIPQMALRYSPRDECMVPAFDFSKASIHGQITVVLENNHDVAVTETVMAVVKERLEDFNENDFFVAVGDPVVIAACAGYILRKLPAMKMLKWDKQLRNYLLIEVKL